LIPLQALHAAIGHTAYCATHIVGNFPNLALQSCALLNTRHSETLLLFGVNRGRFVWLFEPRAMLVSISSAGLKK
jgi:hypothetical protein